MSFTHVNFFLCVTDLPKVKLLTGSFHYRNVKNKNQMIVPEVNPMTYQRP